MHLLRIIICWASCQILGVTIPAFKEIENLLCEESGQHEIVEEVFRVLWENTGGSLVLRIIKKFSVTEAEYVRQVSNTLKPEKQWGLRWQICSLELYSGVMLREEIKGANMKVKRQF